MRILKVLFVGFGIMILLPILASAQTAKLPFDIKIRLQPRFDFGDLLIDKDGSYTSESDLYMRRVRLTAKKEFDKPPLGKKAWTEIVLHMDRLEMDFRNGSRQDPDYKVGVSTAEGVWQFVDEFSLWLGYDIPPFYRNTSSGRLLTFDWISSLGFFDKALGDKQAHLRLFGQAGKGMFKYWVGYGDGANSLSKLKNVDSSASAVQKKDWGNLWSARVEFSPPKLVEAGWDDTGMGKENYVTLGFGYAFQGDLKYDTASVTNASVNTRAYVVDLSGRYRFGEGAATGQVGYVKVDKDYSYKKDESPNGYWVQAGVLIPGKVLMGQIEPVIKYEVLDYNKADKTKTKEKTWTVGFNHYFSKHNLKWGYNLVKTDFEDDVRVASKSGSRLVHQIQFQFDF